MRAGGLLHRIPASWRHRREARQARSACINSSGTKWKAKPLASTLLEEAGVALVGGPDFGILGEGYVRLSYAASQEEIGRALERMGAFLDRHKRHKAGGLRKASA